MFFCINHTIRAIIRAMKRFTKTDLVVSTAEVFRATFSDPIIITDRKKDSHVLMTVERYKELTEKEDKPKDNK